MVGASSPTTTAQGLCLLNDLRRHGLYGGSQECTWRKVLHENRGRKRVAVEHRSGWRFLWHRGHFDTKLLVEQVDHYRHTVSVPDVTCTFTRLLTATVPLL